MNQLECYDNRVWDARGHDLNHNEDCWKPATIVDIRHSVKCCEGTPSEHIHDALFDVQFQDGYISHGLFPTSLRIRK